jgi:hypothetical protein
VTRPVLTDRHSQVQRYEIKIKTARKRETFLIRRENWLGNEVIGYSRKNASLMKASISLMNLINFINEHAFVSLERK